MDETFLNCEHITYVQPGILVHVQQMTMTMTILYSTIDIQIEIIMYNSLENQITNWSGDYY